MDSARADAHAGKGAKQERSPAAKPPSSAAGYICPEAAAEGSAAAHDEQKLSSLRAVERQLKALRVMLLG